MQYGQIRLKAPVYAMQEPTVGAYIALRGERPRLEQSIHLATIVPATPDGLVELQSLATRKLAGMPHELVRIDRL